MKKLISVLLALLMLGSITAFAETESVLTVSNPSLHLETSEGVMDLDLSGLELRAGLLDESALVLNILGDEELLLRAQLRVDGENLVLSADGLSHSYILPATMSIPTEDTAAETAVSFDPTEILTSLAEEAEVRYEEDGSMYFTLPYTAVLSIAEEFVSQMPETDQSAVSQLHEELAQLRESQSGPSLAGVVRGTDDGFSGELCLYMVENGVQPEVPAAKLSGQVAMTEDGMAFSGALEGNGAALCLVEGAYTAAEEAAAFTATFSFDADGSGELRPVAALDVQKTDTDWNLALSMDGDGSGSFFPFVTLDVHHEGDSFLLSLNAAGIVAGQLSYDKATGALSLTGNVMDTAAALTATAIEAEMELVPCGAEGELIDLNAMTEEQQAALEAELQAAFAPVLEFVGPVLAPVMG